MSSASIFRLLGTPLFHRLSASTLRFLHCFLTLPTNRSGSAKRLFPSSTVISSSIWRAESFGVNCGRHVRVRRIWTSSPVCLGRRSSKIAGRKGHKMQKRQSSLYSRIGKEVVSPVKKDGPNPTSNTILATVLEKAKELDVPMDILQRNIKKASEKGQETYIEKIYEVYGYEVVSMANEVSTDKINGSVAAVRKVVKDCGGKMADSGSVMFKFRRAEVVNIKVSGTDKDQLLAIALDAGAEDIIEPPVYDDDMDEDTSEVDDEAMNLNKELMSRLLDLDDVDAVYNDQK